MGVRPFAIDIAEEKLADLKERLARARFPDAIEEGWRHGADLSYMREIAAYWREAYDWRKTERALNALPNFMARIDGLDIHFIHVKGRGPNPAPIVLTHGWPSSIAEFQKIIPLLADPAAHGGDARDAFDVVVPSMPGYGFSDRPKEPGVTATVVAGMWRRLMTEELGYAKFAAHGGDIGARVTNALGLVHADKVIGIHSMATPALNEARLGTLTEAEKAFLAYEKEWMIEEGAYSRQQRTRPQTLAFGLNDSPIGLAAWIIEKWRAWSDCGGDVESRFSKDELLTQASIYWLTETIGSSVRMYFEHARSPTDKEWPDRRIEIPARLFLTTEKVDLCPEEWARRIYADLSYGRAPRGGHFLAAEEPALLADDIRAFFRQFRD
ncbi:MAG: epoxide hydrolase family protein [Parvularculaceae bacterium]